MNSSMLCVFCLAKKVEGIFDSMSDDDDFFTPSITVKSVPKTAPPKKELSESDKKALRYPPDHVHSIATYIHYSMIDRL